MLKMWQNPTDSKVTEKEFSIIQPFLNLRMPMAHTTLVEIAAIRLFLTLS